MNQSKASILLIYTGGTIGMKEDPVEKALRPFDFDQILSEVPELGKFAPLGNRGFIKGRGSGFGNEPWAYQVGSTRLSSGRQWTGYSVRANMQANSA